MRNLILSFLLIFAFSAKAESLPKDYWFVSSDKKVDSINSEVCIVQGTVTDYLGGKVNSGLISTLDRSKYTRTDSLGNFKLTLSKLDTALFFYHEKYSEIVCWKYNFQGGHLVNMHFVCSEKLPDGVMIIEEKPVVYLRSRENIDVTINFENSLDFTFTYPEYIDGWNIKLMRSQMFVDEKSYPYLFWEGQSESLHFSQTIENHCFAKTDTLTSFFEEYLSRNGFNANEQTDFITYWMPRVTQFEYIKFELLANEIYDKRIGEVQVNPIPEQMIRLFFLWEGYNSDLSDIYSGVPEHFVSEAVEGFVYKEWGGAQVLSKIEN